MKIEYWFFGVENILLCVYLSWNIYKIWYNRWVNYDYFLCEVKINKNNTISRIGLKKKKREYAEIINNRYEDNFYFRRRVDYATARKEYKVEDNIILYESYFGRGMTCNPYALFKEIKEDFRFDGFKHVWVFDEIEQHQIEIDEYKDDDSVIFVEEHSKEYFRYLSSAKYLITNVTFQSYFIKKPEQVVINTWHGIPLKHLGFDTPLGNVETANTLRNFLMADYITSACEFTTENFLKAYKLEGLYEGNIIETGYPRNDSIYKADRNSIIDKLKNYGVEVNPNKKVVLYAPTWKGKQYSNPTLDVDSYNLFLETIYSIVDKDKVQVLFKPHQVVYKHMRDKGLLENFYIPATVDTNEILAITDILISDYSSIFFDFLVTGRPILFYIPDIDSYADNRGLYFDPVNLPGPITKEIEQLGLWINDIDNYKNTFKYDNYEKVRSWAVKYDDGHVCERVLNVILGNKDNVKVLDNCLNNKIRVLINNDTMKTNGITTSVTNLLSMLDYDKYDVTLCAGISPGGNVQETYDNICNVNSNVRVYYRNTTFSGTIEELVDNEVTLNYGVINAKKKKCFPEEYIKTCIASIL